MKTLFTFGGNSFEITSDGYLTSPDGASGACSKGSVGIQIVNYPLTAPDEPVTSRTVLQAFLKPSEARAIASAMLSAATEVRAQ